ncbi:MAG: alpha/beta fold hydrolase [Myxococcota bacterium]
MTLPEIPAPHRVELSGLTLSVHEAGEGPAVVFCHGFPDLARSWAHALAAVAGAGYRGLAADGRGYGGSDAPPEVSDYDIVHLTGDLVGLLDAKGIDRAVFVGHDWGGFVVWAMPLLHPERCLGVVGVNTPYVPSPTTAMFRLAFPDPEKFYVLWFQDEGVAEARLDPQARRVLQIVHQRLGEPETLGMANLEDANPFRNVEELSLDGEPLLSPEELDLYADAYARNGFRGPVNWYRNLDRNAELVPQHGKQVLELPCLMVTSAWDVALPPSAADGMKDLCSDLERVDIAACGHFTPREKPVELSRALVDWLDRKIRPIAG